MVERARPKTLLHRCATAGSLGIIKIGGLHTLPTERDIEPKIMYQTDYKLKEPILTIVKDPPKSAFKTVSPAVRKNVGDLRRYATRDPLPLKITLVSGLLGSHDTL